jgi:beta-1,2-mannobiose phosphorylase / 1,2-beta-oligomannan phosphorylase
MGAPTDSFFRARRLSDRPVVSAGSAPGYEPVFNAGLLFADGAYHLFARGVRSGYTLNPGAGPKFLNYVSDILVFDSTDGLDYGFRYVLASAGVHAAGARALEDPRVQRVSNGTGEHVVMTYTHLPSDPEEPWRIGAHRLEYEDQARRFLLEEDSARLLGPDRVANKDAVMFNLADGRIAMLHRIHPSIQVAVFDSLDHLFDASGEYWDAHLAELEHHTIIAPSPGAFAVGAGAPPILTAEGFILFFHERRADGSYTVNAALLDAETGRTISRLIEPVLEPELEWEREGDVDNVVFVQGAHRRDDDTIYLTYGAADRAVGAAVVSERHLLGALAAVR